MKILIFAFMSLLSITTFASDIGDCQIHAISDTSSEDRSPHRVFNHSIGQSSLSKCLDVFNRDIYYLKSCGVVVDGRIHYIELRFTINNRTVLTVEPLNVSCI